MKKISIFIFAALYCFNTTAQTSQQVVDLSTGVVNGTSTLIAPGTNDDTWQVKLPGASTYQPVPCTNGTLYETSTGLTYSGTWSTDPHARWLSPYITGSYSAVDLGPSGDHLYKMSFTATSGCTPISSVLTLNKIGGDNTITSITVNSTSYTTNIEFNPLSSTTITLGSGVLLPGTLNTIIITVQNDADPDYPTFTGLCVYGNLTITSPALVSSFTAPTTVCSGTPITLNGAASTGSIGAHAWGVVECNSLGVPTPGAATWWTGTITGVPGSYTIPAAESGGPTMACGKYYLVTLHVDNNCTEAQSTQIVRLNCTPVANAGPDKNICGGCTSIGAGKTPLGISYVWTSSTGPVGTGKPITVCPSTTTTYTLTATDNSTGCAATDVVTVIVSHNDPAFSWTLGTGSSSYFTITSVANDPNGYSYPGFTYSLKIEELNSAGAVVYTDNGTDAWWYYPTNDFKGFDGTATPPTQTPWWTTPAPAAGKFAYGRNYRITRTTWNDVCPADSYAPIISAPPHMNILAGDKIKIYEGEDAIGFVENLKKKAIEESTGDLNVYPNPSSGIFTIELNNSTKTNMEIYDMLGNKVKEAQIAGTYKLDLTGYSKGVYMIKMIVNEKPVMKKIILE